MSRFAIRDEIRALDPVADHARITHLVACYEFPWDMTRALELALFRTYAVPSIGGLLDRTGEFGARPQKRYDDTDIIVSELMEHGYDSARGRRALRRMNRIHGRFDISNDDFRYVLSTFVFEPIRWIERFGWRPLSEHERLGLFHFWREVGRRMNIRDVPEDGAAFERFNRSYERDHFAFSEASRRVGEATVELFASWGPPVLAPAVRRGIHAMLDDALIEAFGFPRPHPALRRLAPLPLKLRARALRYFPPRTAPRLRTEGRHRSYPRGYVIEALGPPSPPPGTTPGAPPTDTP